MMLIDSGDIDLSVGEGSRSERLFHAIRSKIVANLWKKNNQLPSTRKLALELGVSRNTVIHAYEQLVAEGYIESRRGSGYYVAVKLPEHYFPAQSVAPSGKSDYDPKNASANITNQAFSPGVADFSTFPYRQWQAIVNCHLSRPTLMGFHDEQGWLELREALSQYLAISRSVCCDASRIIITSGAQQALSIALLATQDKGDQIAMECPGYARMKGVIDVLGYQYQPVNVAPFTGLDIESIQSISAKLLYITPSNQYPMGTSLNTEQRLELINWAVKNNRYIIEDDYDSEFQFAHRPYTSMQGLAGKMGQDSQIIYVGSFSKVMFNGLRLGYMVVPNQLVPSCVALKAALSGDSPTHLQAALADFIRDGSLVRHIRRMRRLYEKKYQLMVQSIKELWGNDVEICSQAAGLHITLRWWQGIDEHHWAQLAKNEGIIIRPMSYYDSLSSKQRGWKGAVLGFGNVALEDIPNKMKTLRTIFEPVY